MTSGFQMHAENLPGGLAHFGRARPETASRWVLPLCLAVAVCGCFGEGGRESNRVRPVITVDVPYPTADKPQSKLWYACGRWWAWLPTSQGSSVFERTEKGWRAVESLEGPLTGLVGRADVWADAEGARAVLVIPEQLTVAALRYDEGAQTYQLDGRPTVWKTEDGWTIQTATISRDGTGRWWVAYDYRRRIEVRCSLDENATKWTEPIAISGPTGPDDICAIVTLTGSVGVIWSNRLSDSILFRRHLNESPPDEWEQVVTVDSGGGAADDHLNAAVAADGTLYVTTKDAMDRLGDPQFQLRVRRPDGTWEKHPYAPLRQDAEPSRPIAVLGADDESLFLCHTVYRPQADNSRISHIASIVVETRAVAPGNRSTPGSRAAGSGPLRSRLDGLETTTLIDTGRLVNNATSSKAPLPPEAPGIVFASDGRGNIYEGRLPSGPP